MHNRWVLLSLGGVAGTLARYSLGAWIPQIAGSGFPYGTLAINLSACLLLGLLDSLAVVRGALGPEARLLMMTGFCGAYSTFSTWILETSNLIGDGQFFRAGANLFGSMLAGLLLFRLGAWLGAAI
ncbi:MAG TPA: fluoride efflux transporter CrcB [Elusimicrobiota bacterium]|nr:fluoride efflux transporter CrcB [Elusimicrobiota bacterium]